MVTKMETYCLTGSVKPGRSNFNRIPQIDAATKKKKKKILPRKSGKNGHGTSQTD